MQDGDVKSFLRVVPFSALYSFFSLLSPILLLAREMFRCVMGGKITFIILMWLASSFPDGVEAQATCVSPQYVDLGKRGIVQCASEEHLFEVYWYNSTNYRNTLPIIHLKESLKGGYGYASGEFDIHLNGSLIINNVTMGHDHGFTVVVLSSPDDEVVPTSVDVIVIGTTPNSRQVNYQDSAHDRRNRKKNVGAIITGVLLFFMGATVAAFCFKSCNSNEYRKDDYIRP